MCFALDKFFLYAINDDYIILGGNSSFGTTFREYFRR